MLIELGGGSLPTINLMYFVHTPLFTVNIQYTTFRTENPQWLYDKNVRGKYLSLNF